MIAIDVSTDPGVHASLHDFVQEGGVATDAPDLLMIKPELPIPITFACEILSGNHVNLRYSLLEVRDVVTDANLFAAMWPLLGGEIPERRVSKEGQIALMNAV